MYCLSTNCVNTSSKIVTTVPVPVPKSSEKKTTTPNELDTLPIVTVGKTPRKAASISQQRVHLIQSQTKCVCNTMGSSTHGCKMLSGWYRRWYFKNRDRDI